MTAVHKISGFAAVALLALAAAGSLDVAVNEGRWVYAALGRDRLVEACTPALIRELVQRGFSPQDVEIDGRPGFALAWSGRRSLDAEFTFQDGGAETRVDGTMTCTVDAPAVNVVFRTLARPIRVG